MTPNTRVIHVGQNVSSELDTRQEEGIGDQFKFAANHLDDRIHFYSDSLMSMVINPLLLSLIVFYVIEIVIYLFPLSLKVLLTFRKREGRKTHFLP